MNFRMLIIYICIYSSSFATWVPYPPPPQNINEREGISKIWGRAQHSLQFHTNINNIYLAYTTNVCKNCNFTFNVYDCIQESVSNHNNLFIQGSLISTNVLPPEDRAIISTPATARVDSGKCG